MTHADARPIPGSNLLTTDTLIWRDQHIDLYRPIIEDIARHCPSLRKVMWGLGSPFVLWRGDITRGRADRESREGGDEEKEEIDVEMYLERREI